MKIFKEVPGLKDELEQVALKAREMTGDAINQEPLCDVVDTIFEARGKMLRPALLLLFGRMGGDYLACSQRLISAAAVVELTHMASLVHDDIVDDAPTRRGRATTQARFGKDMAVYAGDYLLSRVLENLMQPDMLRVGQILSRAMSDMCSGELGQYACQFDVQSDEKRYFSNISGKTAALFSASCQIGAVISSCNEKIVSASGRFGHSLGVLFQLRDDLLDCLPDSAADGKSRGMDFINGIYTLPVIHSFAHAAYGEKLRELSGRALNMQAEAVFEELYSYISAAGGVDYSYRIMEEYRQTALSSMELLPESGVKAQLSAALDTLLKVKGV